MSRLGPALLGAFVGILAGAGATLVVTQRTESQETYSASGVNAGAPAAPTEAPQEAPAQAQPAMQIARAEAKPAAPPPVSDLEISEFIRKSSRNSSPPPAADGTGEIAGRIVDADGKPLAGVLVVAERSMSSLPRYDDGARVGLGSPARPTLEEAVRRTMERYQISEGSRRQAISNENGEYRVSGLQATTYFVSAFLEGYRLEASRDTIARGVRPGSQIDFHASRLQELPVRVLLPSGELATAATVQIVQKGGRNARATAARWRSASPTLPLEEGVFTLSAVGEGEQEGWRSAEQMLEVRLGENTAPVELSLVAPRGVRGRVIFPPGSDADIVYVRKLALSSAVAPAPSALLSVREQTWVYDSNYEISQLNPGTYLIGAVTSDGDEVLGSAVVEVTSGMVDRDLIVAPAKTGETLRVEVLGPTGKPVLEASFQLVARGSNGSMQSHGAQGSRQRDGSFRVTVPRGMAAKFAGSWPAGTKYTIHVECKDLGGQDAALSPGQRDVRVQFAAASTLRIVVPNYAGSGLDGQVSVQWGAKSDNSRSVRSLGPDGVLVLDKLAPGAYVARLRIATEDGVASEVLTLEREAVIGSGEAELSIPIPALYPLRVKVNTPAGSRVSLTPLEGDGQPLRSEGSIRDVDASGVASWSRLREGIYELAILGGVGSSMLVTVPSQGEVTFQARAVTALRVTVTDPEGGLAKAGFATGDLVVAIEGQEFQTEAEAQAALIKAMVSETVTFKVQRRGATLELKIPSSAARGQSFGGTLRPADR